MTDRDFRAEIERAYARLTGARTDQMVDTCTVTRPGVGDPVYEGPCTFSNPTSTSLIGVRTTVDESGVPNQRVLKVPHTADLLAGDVVECTSSLLSPGLVGDEFVIVGEDERSYATCRRFQVRGSSWVSPEAGT